MPASLLAVAFLDIVRSTELLGAVGDERGTAAIRRVLDVGLQRVEPYGGRLVKSLGDGLLITFDTPRSAVSFALAVQRALGDTHPQARIGIHFGEVIGDDDPGGSTVHAASRVADRAEGGEILVSDVVRQLAGMIGGVSFADRGRVRLRGFAEPFQLHCVVDSTDDLEVEPVFGRSVELGIVDEMLTSIGRGTGRIVILVGEAGIGKSHLLRAAARRADAARTAVLSGGADELELDRPGRIIAALSGGASSDTGLEASAGSDEGFLLVEAFIDHVENLAQAQPVLVVVDDLQWADELSLRGLAALARRVAPLPVGLLVCLRPLPRHTRLVDFLTLCTERGAIEQTIGGLEPTAVEALATALAGGPPGPVLQRHLDRASGNPLFVSEAIRAVDEHGGLRLVDGWVEAEDAEMPSDLVRTVTRRLSGLSPTTIETLRLASVLGREFTLEDLATIAGRNVVVVAADLRDAFDAGFIRGRGDELVFHHDIVREAVYNDLDIAVRHDLHAAAARALDKAGAAAQRVAQQAALCARRGDENAVRWLLRAADEAEHVDTGRAADLVTRALELAPDGWSSRVVVESRLVELLAWSGHLDASMALAEEVLDRALTPDDELAARRAYGAALSTSGHLADAAGQLELAAGLTADADEAAILRCAAAGMQVIAGGSPTVARDVVATAPSSERPDVVCWTSHTLGVAAICDGSYDESLSAARRSRRLLDTHSIAPLGFLIPHTWESASLFNLDDFDGGHVALEGARQRAVRRGDVGLMMQVLVSRVHVAYVSAEWDDALADVDATLTLAEETGDHVQDVSAHAVAALIALDRAEATSVDEHLAAGETLLAAGGMHSFGADLLFLARARLLDAAGRPEDALAVLAGVWSHVSDMRGLIQWRTLAPALTTLLLLHDERDRAQDLVADLADLGGRSCSTSARATVAWCRALCAENADLLVEAASTLAETPRRLDAALAATDAVQLLRAAGRHAETTPLVELAVSILRDVGATVRVAELLGADSHDDVINDRPAAHGWEALTAKEREVVALVAQGMSNPQIAAELYVSRRTIESHVSNALRKLDATNRTQLAAIALRRTER